jgi:hypothetical protein
MKTKTQIHAGASTPGTSIFQHASATQINSIGAALAANIAASVTVAPVIIVGKVA